MPRRRSLHPRVAVILTETRSATKSLRVVVISQWFPPEKATIPADIASALADRGHKVSVITGYPNYPEGKIYPGWRMRATEVRQAERFTLRRVALYPDHGRSALRRVANYVSFATAATVFGWRDLKAADVVYVYHPPLTSAVGPMIAAKLCDSPYVLHVQDLWPDSVVESGMVPKRLSWLVGRILSALCRTTYRSAAGVIAIAPGMAALIEERGVSAGDVAVVPNWADEDVFLNDEPGRHSLPHESGADDASAFTVMYAGNLGHFQSLTTAIYAASMVADLPSFRLDLVGSGTAELELRALVTRLGLDNVRFRGSYPSKEMLPLLAESDVQLVSLRDLPFFRSTIPSKTATALAAGKPVICAVAGDAAKTVEEAKAGWSVPPEDAAALAAAFRSAYSATNQELSDMADSGRRYYLDRLSRRRGLEKVVSIVEGVAIPCC